MKIDTSDYYPVTPGSSCDENHESEIMIEEVTVSVPQEESHNEVETLDKDESHNQEVSNNQAAPNNKNKDLPEEPWQRVVDRISNVLSWVLVPLLMPLYALMICFRISVLQFASLQTKWAFCIIVFCITALIPMILIVILKKLGLINDVGLNGRKERLIPYIITILSFAGAGWFMVSKGAPLWIGMFFFGGACAGVINLIVNFWWKISAHAAGIAGVVALLICISREPIPHPHIEIWVSCALALAGLLGGARVWLGRHTVLQVLAGSAVGFLSVFFLTL